MVTMGLNNLSLNLEHIPWVQTTQSKLQQLWANIHIGQKFVIARQHTWIISW